MVKERECVNSHSLSIYVKISRYLKNNDCALQYIGRINMVCDQVNNYICRLIKKRDPILLEMEQFAANQDIPIMELVGIEAMLQILALAKPNRVLEIGTAIGYSAIRIAMKLPDCSIVTIERDKERYELAKQFIKKAGLDERITVLHGDALEVEKEVVSHFSTFDALFIDAAKGQYKRFFEMYSKYMNKEGLIISDNILFKGIVAREGTIAKGMRTMVTNLQTYNEMLMENEEYDTAIFPIGDGIAVSKKL